MSGPTSSLSKDDGGEQVSSHRRASACLPHGDGIEIAFSDLPVKLSPVSPPQLSKEPLPTSSSYLGSGRTALSQPSAAVSVTIERRGPRRQHTAWERQAEVCRVQVGWGDCCEALLGPSFMWSALPGDLWGPGHVKDAAVVGLGTRVMTRVITR